MDVETQYFHADAFTFLNENKSLNDKLVASHQLVQGRVPQIARIAVALYDPETSLLKAFMHSSGDDHSMEHYQATLENAPSLMEILKRGKPRVINNMVTIERPGQPEHVKRLGRQGYAASYTLPMFDSGVFVGFLFFNSCEKDVFTDEVLHELDLYGHLISLMVISELNALKTLAAALKTTGKITHIRDPETGSHLDRMSRYSRVIARELAEKYHLDDEYIEHIFMFSPLHDIGKIAIPDHILRKPGKLTNEEMTIMKTHARKGREIIDSVLENFGLGGIPHTDILRNIAEFHHEAMNGSGYPHGKYGNSIPLEARIVAVADMFDALTSRRPYKEAWSNEEAFDLLKELAGERLDQDCVNALLGCADEIEEIQYAFKESMVA